MRILNIYGGVVVILVVIVVVDDLYFYMFHSWMHSNKYFFKKIHSTHHKTIAPIAMEEKLRFAIREGGRTVGAGVVAKIIE